MIKHNFIQFSDGTYEAGLIECSSIEGNTCALFLKDIESGKARHIGELKCYDEQGKLIIYKNLLSRKR